MHKLIKLLDSLRMFYIGQGFLFATSMLYVLNHFGMVAGDLGDLFLTNFLSAFIMIAFGIITGFLAGKDSAHKNSF